MRNFVRAFALFCGAIMLLSCDSGLTPGALDTDGLSNSDDNSAGTQPLSEERKQEALRELNKAFRSFPHESNEGDNELLAAAILANEAFSSAEVGDGAVFATFADGEDYVFLNDVPYEERLPGASGQSTAARRALPAKPRDVQKGNSDTRMVLVNTSRTDVVDGRIVQSALDDILRMGRERGYFVSEPSQVSYAEFCNSFQDMDCLIWFGHAGALDGRFVFAIPNFAEVNEQHQDMKDKLLLRANHTDWVLDWEEQSLLLGTAEFARRYWRFDKGGFLLWNTCFGASDKATLFRKTCFEDAKLEAFIGWTWKSRFTDMAESARVFADMVTGANANFKDYHPNAGSEPTRAWSYVTTLSNMATISHKTTLFGYSYELYFLTRSYTGFRSEVLSELVYRRASGSESGGADSDTVFEPGIMTLTVDESPTSPSRLIIDGSFGDERGDGKVTMNGAELNVTSWTHTTVICDLPNDGDNAAGTVVVERHGRTSNPVNLTMWYGPLYYTENYNCSDPQIIEWHTTHYGSMIVRLRGDVHAFRTDPASPPQAQAVGLSAMQGRSSLTDYYSMGTIEEPHFDEDDREVARTIDTFSRGPGTMTPDFFANIDGNVFFSLRFQPQEHNVVVTHGSFNIVKGEHVVSEYRHPIIPYTSEYDSNLDLALGAILGLIDPIMTLAADSFDTGFLSAEQTVDSKFISSGNGEAQGKIKYSLQVGPFSATHAPDAAAPR